MSPRFWDHFAGKDLEGNNKPDNCYLYPRNHRTRAYCEGCRTHVPVKSKAEINKGWHCPECRRKA